MAQIGSIIEKGQTFSYEFSPPRTQEQASELSRTIGELIVTRPDFLSVTCIGDSPELTKDVAIKENARWIIPTMAHLTCAGQTKADITRLLDDYVGGGVDNILALRGDGKEPGEFKYATNLVELIKDNYPSVSVGVAAHPEAHPDSSSTEEDRKHLAEKLSIADFAVCQFFFEKEHYGQLIEDLDALGCSKPVIPGIMLFRSVPGLRRMAGLNNTSLPPSLIDQLNKFDKTEDIEKVAVETAAQLIIGLSEYEVPGLHIYTMNKSGPALALKGMLPPSDPKLSSATKDQESILASSLYWGTDHGSLRNGEP